MIGYLLSFSLLILAVLLFRRIFRKTVSPRVIYALWLVVVIRMILPITLFEVEVIQPGFLQNVQEAYSGGLPNVQEDTVSSVQTVLATPARYAAPSDWKRTVNLVWFGGTVMAAGWVILIHVSFNRQLVRDRRLHKTVHGVKVYVSESVGVPCIGGWIPSVYITPDAADNHSEKLIIRHELIHLRHGDSIWSGIRALALIVFWWNPLVWTAAVVSKQDAELACDDTVSESLNDEERLQYANILLNTIPQRRRFVAGFGSSPLKERILRLTTVQQNRRISLTLVVLLTLTVAGCSFMGVNTQHREPMGEMPNGTPDILPTETLGEDASAFRAEEKTALQRELEKSPTEPDDRHGSIRFYMDDIQVMSLPMGTGGFGKSWQAYQLYDKDAFFSEQQGTDSAVMENVWKILQENDYRSYKPDPDDSGYHCMEGHSPYCVVTRYSEFIGEDPESSCRICFYTHSLGRDVDVYLSD